MAQVKLVLYRPNSNIQEPDAGLQLFKDSHGLALRDFPEVEEAASMRRGVVRSGYRQLRHILVIIEPLHPGFEFGVQRNLSVFF